MSASHEKRSRWERFSCVLLRLPWWKLWSQRELPPSLLLIVILTGLVVILFQIFVVQNSGSQAARTAAKRTASSAALYFRASMTALNQELRALVQQHVLSVENHAQLLLRRAMLRGRCCSCFTNEFNLAAMNTTATTNFTPIDIFRRSIQQERLVITIPVPSTPARSPNLSKNELPRCDARNNRLQGRLHDSWHSVYNRVLPEHVRRILKPLSAPLYGGRYSPPNCQPPHSIVIVIPYRDRAEHLRMLLAHLHPILQRQQLCYRVVVVEQAGKEVFNKAMLMNAAVLETLRIQWTDCFIFHDVDMVPEDDRIPYHCPDYPRHMSVALNKHNYQLLYEDLVGGVLAFPTRHFLAVNGYSNLFWGWGGEDDDMAARIKATKLQVTRPDPHIGRYTMIRHAARFQLPLRHQLIHLSAIRYPLDGLNSIRYNLTQIQLKPLYTHMLIDVGPAPPRIHLRPMATK